MTSSPSSGRVTLPTEVGAEQDSIDLIARLGADAVRNSDGTELPEQAAAMVDKVYATYFVARGDQEWAKAHPDELQQLYLLSERVTATAPAGQTKARLVIDPMVGYFDKQVRPDVEHDPHTWWEVRNRTTGDIVPPSDWHLEGAVVVIPEAQPWHEYTVAFLAWALWDPTQMYNYLTNGWENTDRVREMPYDGRHPETWAFMKETLDAWLVEHPEVDVVRFTTFFYHFTLVFNDRAKEKFVDWFGYSASVSVPALEAFEAEFGYRLTPEDFVDAGYYNSPFRVPRREFRDWIDFQNRFVTGRVKELVDAVHESGKEAMMFLGDNWIGTEPYGEHFAQVGMDAVVGSVGSAATTRMIADIPGVKYTEGRLLPYFFPDVFTPGGDPLGEAQASWAGSRRGILRNPLDRIGYGGYVSLAVQFPEFLDYAEQVANEFRSIHDRPAGAAVWTAPLRVAVLNHWGKLRTWQTHMVAHALEYKQIVTYLGALEALAGLPVDVEFISFDEVLASGVPEGIDVVLNVGHAGTAFSGGEVWADPALTSCLRAWVAGGGGLVGIGEPSAHLAGGRTFQLADVLGVDQEVGFTLSTDKYVTPVEDHFITADLSAKPDTGEGARNVYPVTRDVEVLSYDDEVLVAANEYGSGRGVFLAGTPFSAQNARLIMRSLLWAARQEGSDRVAPLPWWSTNPAVDVAAFPDADCYLVANSSRVAQETTVHLPGGATVDVELAGAESRWFEV